VSERGPGRWVGIGDKPLRTEARHAAGVRRVGPAARSGSSRGTASIGRRAGTSAPTIPRREGRALDHVVDLLMRKIAQTRRTCPRPRRSRPGRCGGELTMRAVDSDRGTMKLSIVFVGSLSRRSCSALRACGGRKAATERREGGAGEAAEAAPGYRPGAGCRRGEGGWDYLTVVLAAADLRSRSSHVMVIDAIGRSFETSPIRGRHGMPRAGLGRGFTRTGVPGRSPSSTSPR